MYLSKSTATELKSLISQFRDTFLTTSEASRGVKIRSLNPGEKIPAKGALYDNEHIETFNAYSLSARDRMRNILDKESEDLKKKMAEAPSVEAVNALTVLNMRNNISQDEINSFIDNYGDNYQAYKAIASIASDKGLNTWKSSKVNDIDSTLKKIEELRSNLEKALTTSSAMAHHDKNGYYEMLNMMIDGTSIGG